METILPPSFAGWTLSARVDFADNGAVVCCAPDVAPSPSWRDCGNRCDHCGQNRNRARVFVLRKGDAEKVVGSTCLREFLVSEGCNVDNTPTGEEMEDLNWHARVTNFPWQLILAHGVALVRAEGYRKSADANPTWKQALSQIFKRPQDPEWNLAGEAIDWLRGQNSSSEYICNLQALGNWIHERHIPLAISLAPTYLRELERRKQAACQSKSEWVGTVGERREFQAVIQRVMIFQGNFGPNYITILLDKEGNVLVGKQLGKQGDEVRFVATVDAHEERNGVKQTRVLRAKFV